MIRSSCNSGLIRLESATGRRIADVFLPVLAKSVWRPVDREYLSIPSLGRGSLWCAQGTRLFGVADGV